VAPPAAVVRAVDPGPVAVSPLVRNGTWAHALTVLHAAARESDRRAERTPSMVVIDTHLARGAANGGSTFHDRGSPYGRTKGARRVIAVDVTGLPVAALVVFASTHENRTSELILEHLSRQGVTRPARTGAGRPWGAAASAAPGAWRSRSRTPPPRRPTGYRSPASPPRCARANRRRSDADLRALLPQGPESRHSLVAQG
jgi:hypothetical protein